MNGWSILRGILTDVDIDAEIERGRWKKEGDVAAAYPIWKWCLEEDISILQLAIQFCLREERIHGNNIGSLNVEQLEANVRAASTPLPDEVWEKYEAKFGSKN
jgi:aryl-alcohol dehydrogenase-like predicted oxidoreductase